MARPKLTPEEREKRKVMRSLRRNFFMEALRREDAAEAKPQKRPK